MTIVIYGAGAVGSLFGARFAAAGHRVLLIGRPDHVAAIRERGLHVEGVGAGTFACDAATELPAGTAARLVVLGVKTFDLASAARDVGRRLAPAPVLLPQNGLRVEPGVAAALASAGWPDARARLVRAVHTVPATLVAPGVVRAAGAGEVVLPVPADAGPSGDGARAFAQLFRDAGFSVRIVDSIEREVWRKAIVNAAINPVTAVHRVPNGALAAPPLREEAHALLVEAHAVAAAVGAAGPLAESEADLERVVRGTAENRSSMLQDLDRGRPTEIDAISGAILDLAIARGVDVPATRAAVERVRAAAARAARPAQSS